MLINDKDKKFIIVPMKCGSSSFRELYKNSRHWFDITSDEKLDSLPYTGYKKIQAIFDSTGRNLHDYHSELIIRDPVSWLVSGFRFLKSYGNQRLPFHYQKFIPHLRAVLNDNRKDLFWSDHCSVMPDEYWFEGCVPVRLETLQLPVSENVTPKKVEYPYIDQKAARLITKITKNYCQLFDYDIEKSIKYYNSKLENKNELPS